MFRSIIVHICISTLVLVVSAHPVAAEGVSFEQLVRIDPPTIGHEGNNMSLTLLQDEDTTLINDNVDAPGMTEPLRNSQSVRAKTFGEEGTWRYHFNLSYADQFDDANFVSGSVGVSYFFIENLSLNIELQLLAVSQDGPNSTAVALNLLFRYHFYTQDTWSLYFDGGAGILKGTQDIPADGSSFNFTPQLGFGVSFDVGKDWRGMVGVRWYHISNANTRDSNPGRDHFQVYGGLSLPF